MFSLGLQIRTPESTVERNSGALHAELKIVPVGAM